VLLIFMLHNQGDRPSRCCSRPMNTAIVFQSVSRSGVIPTRKLDILAQTACTLAVTYFNENSPEAMQQLSPLGAGIGV